MAKTDLEEMVLRMSADINRFEKSMQKAVGVGNQAAGRIEKRFKDMNKGITAAFAGFGSGIAAAFTVAGIEKFALAARDAIKAVADIGDNADKLGLTTDEYQKMAFAAQLAGVETEGFVKAIKTLAVNSSEAASGQGELGKLFAANGIKIKDANGQMLDQTRILGIVADLTRNAASEQDRAAIAQIAMGKNGVDMLNLLAGGADAVKSAMQQAADANISLTEDQIRKAQEYDDQLDTLVETISVRLKGSFIDFAETSLREIDALVSAASQLGSILAQVAAVDAQSQQAAANVANARAAILNKGTRFGPFNGGLAAQPTPSPAPVSSLDGKGSLPGNLDSDGTLHRTTRLPPPKVTKPKKTKREKVNDFERSTQSVKENISLLQAELGALGQNTFALAGYDQAIEKARISEGLLNDAKKAGLKITPELKAKIDGLAGSYAGMQAAVDAARQKHEQFVQSVDDLKDLSKDVLGGFIDDLIAGKSATDALLGGLSKIADKLIDMAVNSLVENAFSGLFDAGGVSSGGGFLGGLFGFAKGGVMTSRGPLALNAYASGGVANSPQLALFGEGRSPEAFVPLPDGRNIPVKMQGGGGGSANLTQHITISGTGDAQLMANLKNIIAISNRELIEKLPGLNVQRQLRVE